MRVFKVTIQEKTEAERLENMFRLGAKTALLLQVKYPNESRHQTLERAMQFYNYSDTITQP